MGNAIIYIMKINTTKVFLVIPTIRDLNFLKSWGTEFKNCHLLVVEDHPTKTINVPNKNFKSVRHYTWKDIDSDLGENSWIISRFNSGIRSYGFWKAYELGASAIITLDDDCYPEEKDYVKKHIGNLEFEIPLKWINTYPDPDWMFTRGIPYTVRNKIKAGLSHGLWSGALDLDAKTEIKLHRLLSKKAYPPLRNIIPFDYYYPMCSMNFGFRREITPLMYFPMMGKDENGKSWSYDRYDDIWAGLFSKKIMDHLGVGVISGSPIVDHRKASKPHTNHEKEKLGMMVNERLWKEVDKVRLTKNTSKACYIELAKNINFPKNTYFKKLKEAMLIWANLF